jgi:polar amino acid transport system substrate-binding protein
MSRLGIPWILAAILAALIASGVPVFAQQSPDSRIADLAQAGKLRVGLFASQFTKDAATGELKNVRVDISRALAARMGVPVVFIEHRTPPDVIECLKAGGCDVVFLPRDARAAAVGVFSNPLIISEFTMLIPADSAIQTIADADRPGIRIAAVRSHASTATLMNVIKSAEIIVGDNEDAAFLLLKSGQADVFASTRQYLTRMMRQLAGSRVLPERYGANAWLCRKGRRRGSRISMNSSRRRRHPGFCKRPWIATAPMSFRWLRREMSNRATCAALSPSP